MPRTKQQNQMIKDERKKHIASCALKLFCLKGFDGTQMTDIAKQAEISHGLIYHYFKSKQEIFDYLFLEFHLKSLNKVIEISEEKVSYYERLYKITEIFIDNFSKNKDFSLMFFTAITKRFKDLLDVNYKEKKIQSKNNVFLIIFRLLKEAKETNEFNYPFSIEQAISLYFSIIQGNNLAFILCPENRKSTFEFIKTDTVLSLFIPNTIKGEDKFAQTTKRA